MMVSIKSPITLYAGSNSVIISQADHTKELFDYYWTSYSRGTDGRNNVGVNEPLWNNTYLDGYIQSQNSNVQKAEQLSKNCSAFNLLIISCNCDI